MTLAFGPKVVGSKAGGTEIRFHDFHNPQIMSAKTGLVVQEAVIESG